MAMALALLAASWPDLLLHAQEPVYKHYQAEIDHSSGSASTDDNDWIYDLKHTADGGKVVCGYAAEYVNGQQKLIAAMMKTDHHLNRIWDQTFALDSDCDMLRFRIVNAHGRLIILQTGLRSGNIPWPDDAKTPGLYHIILSDGISGKTIADSKIIKL